MSEIRPFAVDEASRDWESTADSESAQAMYRWKLLLGGERTPTAGLTMGIVELPPGEGRAVQLHHHEPVEVYHGLSGRGVIEVEGERFELAPGSTVFIPGNAGHRTTNSGDEPLRFLWIFPTDTLREVVYHRADGLQPIQIVV